MVVQVEKIIPYNRDDGEKDIDLKYPSETPGKDDMHQPLYIAEILIILKNYFADQPYILVSGDTFIYYEQGNPRVRFRPDSYVVIGVDVAEVYVDDTYVMWRCGKAPDFAMEIGSKSTYRNDLGHKRELYARLGIREYWRYDWTGGEYYGEPLVGEYLHADGEYRRLEMLSDPDGTVRGYSPVLGLELRWESGLLRFWNPDTQSYLPSLEESEAAREDAEVALVQSEVARLSTEVELRQSEAARLSMEVELRQSETARRDAEIARQDAETARLNAETDRLAAEAEATELRERLRRLEQG